MFFSRPYVHLAPVCVRSRACASVLLNPIIRPRPSSYVCVCTHTCAFVHVRLRPCPYDCIRALASAFVRVHASAFVCVHIIKSPDASARIISNASGRVFRSKDLRDALYVVHFCAQDSHRLRASLDLAATNTRIHAFK